MSRKILLKGLAGIFMMVTFSAFNALAQNAPVPKTGQTTSYATGDDGNYQKGVAWPSPRFTDNGDGTVTDNMTGLIWTKNAQEISGKMTWADALTASENLVLGSGCGCTDCDDWRLPNVRELQSLLDYGNASPVLPSAHPFTNVKTDDLYWSSTSGEIVTDDAFVVHMLDGAVLPGYLKTYLYYVWPVRGTTNGPAPVPKTGQTNCYDSSGTGIPCAGTGQDGEYQKGVAWPSPRFTDNGDGTVIDNMTGLIWTKNAQIISGLITWAEALTACENFVLGSGCGCTDCDDWRLPNVREIQSLIDYGEDTFGPNLPAGHPFYNVSSWNWSSTTSEYYPSAAWYVRIGSGLVLDTSWTSSLSDSVWPVRGGQ